VPIFYAKFKKKKVTLMMTIIDNSASIASNQPIKNVYIDLISNQNKGIIIESIVVDIGTILNSKSKFHDFTKIQFFENH